MTSLVIALLVIAHQDWGSWLKDYRMRFPSSLPVSHDEVLERVVPNYQEKKNHSAELLADPNHNPLDCSDTYDAAVIEYRRTDLGIKGEDFLIVAIQELNGCCRSCYACVFGGLDLKRRRNLGALRAESSNPKDPLLELVRKRRPWRMVFHTAFPGDSRCRIVTKHPAWVVRSKDGGWGMVFGDSKTKTEGNCNEN